MTGVTILFIVLLVSKSGFELWLELKNRQYVKEFSGQVPDAYSEFIDHQTYKRSIGYTLAKNLFGIWKIIFDTIFLALIILSGFLPWLFAILDSILGGSSWANALILFLVGTVIAIPSIPWDWWSQFRLEERFGFNKSSQKLWIADRIKVFVLALAIGYPVICFLLWIVTISGWWLFASAAVFGLQVVLMILYPMFIMPLFNKLEPLPVGDLRDRLMNLSDRTGFKTKSIQVMDGSKRSGHSNAFFTGFGRFRRIVLFDTLIEQISDTEVESVLAHEIGHYKLGHIPRILLLSALSVLLAFFILSWLLKSSWFYEGFGFSLTGGISPAFILFSLLSGLVSFWFVPFMNCWSRTQEFEADAFASGAVGGYGDLVSSLRKLTEKNLSNLTPHPLYSRFHYSHPTLLERESALRAK